MSTTYPPVPVAHDLYAWKLAPLVYDQFFHHPLQAQAPCCRWGPWVAKPDAAPYADSYAVYYAQKANEAQRTPHTLVMSHVDLLQPNCCPPEVVAKWVGCADQSPYLTPQRAVVHPGEVHALHELHGRPHLVATIADSSDVMVWDMPSQAAWAPDTLKDSSGPLPSANTPDLLLHRASPTQPSSPTPTPDFGAAYALAASRDLPVVASGCRDGTVAVWDLGDYVTSLADSTSGGGGSGKAPSVKLQPRARLTGHGDRVTGIVIRPLSLAELVSVGRDNVVCYWDLRVSPRPMLRIVNAHGVTPTGQQISQLSQPKPTTATSAGALKQPGTPGSPAPAAPGAAPAGSMAPGTSSAGPAAAAGAGATGGGDGGSQGETAKSGPGGLAAAGTRGNSGNGGSSPAAAPPRLCVQCVDWNAVDYNSIATGSEDGSVRVWDIRVLQGRGVAPNSPQARTALTQRYLYHLRHPAVREGGGPVPVHKLEWSPKVKGLLACCGPEGPAIWNLAETPTRSALRTALASGKALDRVWAVNGSAPPGVVFFHRGHKTGEVVDFQWHPSEPWAALSLAHPPRAVHEHAEEAFGSVVQVWRPHSLLCMPRSQALAQLAQHRDYIINGKTMPARAAAEGPVAMDTS